MQMRVTRSLLLAAAMLFVSSSSFAQIGVSVTIAPPPLVVYEQPMAPGDGYIWTPGYWAWDDGYYWVPGTWVLAPEPGFLWTPGYWGWSGSAFVFNEGYWGPTVGFYGGINYGFGYGGHGYDGGRWENGHFFYNTAVNRVNVNVIHNVYSAKVNVTVNRVSYNGGTGGIAARATSQEMAAARAKRSGPVAAQTQHAFAAHNDPKQRLSANHGTPPVAATARPTVAVHAKELPPIARPAAPVKTGDAKVDQNNQKEQDALVAKQTQERQALQQKQDQEHAQAAKENASAAKTAQMEQQHQQQTQQLQQQHAQQMRQLQQRQQRPAGGGRGKP
jgi:WXXGXW repeat (2 copies)